jgi:hypothetical protein
VEHLEAVSLGYAPALPGKHHSILERLAREKHSSFLQKFVNYGRKKGEGKTTSLLSASFCRRKLVESIEVFCFLRGKCTKLGENALS